MTAEGHFVEGLLTRGNVHNVTVADKFFENVVGCCVIEDAGYDSDSHRQTLMANNTIPMIPGRKNRRVLIEYDEKLYKLCKRIEMFFGKIKKTKRLSMLLKKLDKSFLGFIALASLKIILRSIIS